MAKGLPYPGDSYPERDRPIRDTGAEPNSGQNQILGGDILRPCLLVFAPFPRCYSTKVYREVTDADRPVPSAVPISNRAKAPITVNDEPIEKSNIKDNIAKMVIQTLAQHRKLAIVGHLRNHLNVPLAKTLNQRSYLRMG